MDRGDPLGACCLSWALDIYKRMERLASVMSWLHEAVKRASPAV